MLAKLRAEHILAILITSIFLLCDIAVLCFFISAFDPSPDIKSHSSATEYRTIQTPMLSVQTLTLTTFGGNLESNDDVIKQLEDAISAQLEVLTDNKKGP